MHLCTLHMYLLNCLWTQIKPLMCIAFSENILDTNIWVKWHIAHRRTLGWIKIYAPIENFHLVEKYWPIFLVQHYLSAHLTLKNRREKLKCPKKTRYMRKIEKEYSLKVQEICIKLPLSMWMCHLKRHYIIINRRNKNIVM